MAKLRFLWLCFLISGLLPLLLGMAIGVSVKAAALFGGIITLLFLFFVFLQGESWVLRSFRFQNSHHSRMSSEKGLMESFESALFERKMMESKPGTVGYRGFTRPEIRVALDPAPNLWVARSPFSFSGKGTLILSRGLLDLLTEKELRAVMAEAARRVTDSNLSWKTLASGLAIQLSALMPKLWKERLSRGTPLLDQISVRKEGGQAREVFQTASALLSYTWVRAFLGLMTRYLEPTAYAKADPDFISAKSKIDRANMDWSGVSILGAVSLSLFHPWPQSGSNLLSVAET